MPDKKEGIVIDLNPDGSARALHHDRMPLSFLGAMHLERASEIEFHCGSQTFYITFRDYPMKLPAIDPFRGFTGYDEARAFEVMFLQYVQLHQLRIYDDTLLAKVGAHVRSFFNEGVRELRRVPAPSVTQGLSHLKSTSQFKESDVEQT